jgi:hypothetical protein
MPDISSSIASPSATTSNKVVPNVQIVLPTADMIEAHNSLCRRVWNNNNAIKAKRKSTKLRRRALNHAAAKSRWDKKAAEKLVLESMGILEPPKKEYERKRVMWYDSLLKNYGINYAGGFEHLLGHPDTTNWEETIDDIIASSKPAFLTVLHDHSYFKGYVPCVQDVVNEIRTTLAELVDNGDEGII